MFFHFRISHVLRFISIFDLSTDSLLQLIQLFFVLCSWYSSENVCTYRERERNRFRVGQSLVGAMYLYQSWNNEKLRQEGRNKRQGRKKTETEYFSATFNVLIVVYFRFVIWHLNVWEMRCVKIVCEVVKWKPTWKGNCLQFPSDANMEAGFLVSVSNDLFIYFSIIPMRWIFFNWPNPSSRTMALGSTQPLTEMSTRKIPGG
jgi:hypothetical protein